MALVVGTNSYCDAAFAKTYAEDREGTNDFLNLLDEDLDRLLVSATDFLDTLVWVGEATVSTQALAWPRDGTYYDPKIADNVTLDNDTPIEVQEATVELAMSFLANGSLTGAQGGPKSGTPDSIKVGSIELDGLNQEDRQNAVIGGVAMPTMVASLIGHLLAYNTASSGLFRPWFRAW